MACALNSSACAPLVLGSAGVQKSLSPVCMQAPKRAERKAKSENMRGQPVPAILRLCCCIQRRLQWPHTDIRICQLVRPADIDGTVQSPVLKYTKVKVDRGRYEDIG